MDYHQYSNCKFRIPQQGIKVLWEITNTCNYACSYCIFASTGKKYSDELSTEEVFTALESLAKAGVVNIKFTGGEPFLRSDMLDILARTLSLGITCDVSTNASLITPVLAQQLSLLPLDFIHVSLDGADAPTHEMVRDKSTFAKTIQGLKVLLAADCKVRVGCVIHQGNENNLKDIEEFCHRLGVVSVIFSKLYPIGTRAPSVLKKRVASNFPETQLEHKLEELNLASNLSANLASITARCPAGTHFLYLNNRGEIYPCSWLVEHTTSFGNIKQQNLETILLNLRHWSNQTRLTSCPKEFIS